MTSLPEQFSAARQHQLDQSFQWFNSLTDQALERTARVLALQLDASRTAVTQSSATLQQLLAARQPADLLALGSQSQQQLHTLFELGRQWFGVAAGAGAQTPAAPTMALVSEPVIEPVIDVVVEPVIDVVVEPVMEAVTEPVVEAITEPEVEAELVQAPLVTSTPEPLPTAAPAKFSDGRSSKGRRRQS